MYSGEAAIATRLRAGRFGVRIVVGAREFSLLNVQTGCGAHPASYSMGAGIPSREYRSPDGKLIYSLPSRLCLLVVYPTKSVEVCKTF